MIRRLKTIRCSTSELGALLVAYEAQRRGRRLLDLNLSQTDTPTQSFPFTVTEARQLRNTIDEFLALGFVKGDTKAASPKKSPVAKSHRQIGPRDRAPGGSRSGTKRGAK